MERESTHFYQFSMSLFSTRTYLTEELAILKSGSFRNQIFLFGFSSLKLQTSFGFLNAKSLTNQSSKTASKLIIQKLRNMNLLMKHAFFSCLLFLPNILTCYRQIPSKYYNTCISPKRPEPYVTVM